LRVSNKNKKKEIIEFLGEKQIFFIYARGEKQGVKKRGGRRTF